MLYRRYSMASRRISTFDLARIVVLCEQGLSRKVERQIVLSESDELNTWNGLLTTAGIRALSRTGRPSSSCGKRAVSVPSRPNESMINNVFVSVRAAGGKLSNQSVRNRFHNNSLSSNGHGEARLLNPNTLLHGISRSKITKN